MLHPAFLSDGEVRRVQRDFGTPVFVYDEATLMQRASEVLAFPSPHGLTARYAMKALPSAAIVQLLHRAGLHIDASSGHEAVRAMRLGVPGAHILLTAQQLPGDLEVLLDAGVRFNACSLHQLRAYGGLRPGGELSVRINPGLGSGHVNRTNVGGPSSSFGIWHAHLDEVLEAARECGLRIVQMHTHIGSGSDPEVWVRCAHLALGIAARLPDVVRLGLGGGYKVARMPNEKSANLGAIGGRVVGEIERFAEQTGRRLHIEIEPGTYLVANAGAIVCTAIDVVDTLPDGFRFIKIDSGMTEVVRPSMYGAQHPISVVPAAETDETSEYLVVGHCCESGDVLTPEPGNPEGLAPRTLRRCAVGDAVVIDGAGAYCAGMSAKHYNSFPEAPEVLRRCDGSFVEIRARQPLEQLWQNERPLAD